MPILNPSGNSKINSIVEQSVSISANNNGSLIVSHFNTTCTKYGISIHFLNN